MRYYLALIHQRDANRFSAEVPDFPCCIADGASAEEAVDNARKLMERRITAFGEGAMELPESRSLKAAMAGRRGRAVVGARRIAALHHAPNRVVTLAAP